MVLKINHMNRTNISSIDLEFGVGPIPTPTPTPNVSNNPIMNTRDEDLIIWKLKLCICLTILFIGLPMAFCDIYFGYNDKSCVSNPVTNIDINLYDYLIVAGWSSIGMILIFMIGIILLDPLMNSILYFIALLMSIFSFCWNIIGGVIFYSFIDNTTCSQSVFNYVSASLIIKYVFTLLGIIMSRNNKD
jgi:hypothetical protein